MAQAQRPRLTRAPKQEVEIRLIDNPIESRSSLTSSYEPSTPLQRERLTGYDYQAPLTSHSLVPNSKWLIVRRNIHRIRFMGFNETNRENRLPDFYLGLQMTRELKRAQEEIKNVDKEEDFHIIKAFSLANDSKGMRKTFNTSHVKPNDALIYDRLGEEPLALQNLLYYFSKQDVPHGTVFWNFLNEVNQVLNLNRKRTVLVQRLRRLALTLAIIVYSFIGLMFIMMIVSVITTATKMNDPEVEWMNQQIGGYSNNYIGGKKL